MRTFPITLSLLFLIVLTGIAVQCQIPPGGTEKSIAVTKPPLVIDLGRILKDERLWGADAFALFGSLDRWKEFGESSILVFPDRVASETQFDSVEEAERGAARMARFMNLAQVRLRPPFSALYADAVKTRGPQLRAEFSAFLEDESYRVVWKSQEGEFIKKDLKIESVVDWYGEPEKITTQVVHAQGERRPLILTNYHYADNKIVFVELNLAPMPGRVDRVVLSVAAAADLTLDQ